MGDLINLYATDDGTVALRWRDDYKHDELTLGLATIIQGIAKNLEMTPADLAELAVSRIDELPPMYQDPPAPDIPKVH